MRSLSCFCGPCIDQDWEKCEVMSHVPLWRPIKLQPKDIKFVRIQLEVVEEIGIGEHEANGEIWLLRCV